MPHKTPGPEHRLRSLVEEVVSTFHLLRAASSALYGDGEQSASRRGVLRSLARDGPQTVPRLASARPVSRQFIQQLVNLLSAEGLVTLAPNPAHARSRLVMLTEQGVAMTKAMDQAEGRVYRRLARRLELKDLERTRATLGDFRRALREVVPVLPEENED